MLVLFRPASLKFGILAAILTEPGDKNGHDLLDA